MREKQKRLGTIKNPAGGDVFMKTVVVKTVIFSSKVNPKCDFHIGLLEGTWGLSMMKKGPKCLFQETCVSGKVLVGKVSVARSQV